MRELRFAIKCTIPIFFTYLFIGIAYGILMHEAGYGVLMTAASSLFIYAGSMQLVMVPMLTSGTSLITLALMTFFINARHIFYGVGFVDRFRRMGLAKPYMIMSLTDETYSVLCSVKYDSGIDKAKADLLISACDHFYWIAGSVIGNCAGRYLSFDLHGIEFSLTAFFIVVVADQWRQYRTKLPFLIAAVCSFGFCSVVGKEYFLIPTLLTSLFLLLLLRRKIGNGKENVNE